VLVDAGIPGIDPIGSPVIPRVLWHFGFHIERDLPEALVAGRERVYMVSFFQRYAVNKEAFTAEEVDHFVASYARPGRMTAGFEWYRAFDGDAAYNKAELLPTKLPMPTLVVGGGAFGTTTAQLQALGDTIATTARAALLPDSGHWIAEEQPEKLVALVRDFIEGGVQ
jgi:pimeloyl-ACP methyl ester carboxylesterase